MTSLNRVTLICNARPTEDGEDSCGHEFTRAYGDEITYEQRSYWARVEAAGRQGWGVRPARDTPEPGDETEVDLCPAHLAAYDIRYQSQV